MKKVIIFGNGQMAEIAHVYLAQERSLEIAAFTVNQDCLKGDSFRGLPVIAFEEIVKRYPPADYWMFIPIGAKKLNQLRAEKYFEAKTRGYRFISYISPQAWVSPEVVIGENCFILENNVIQPSVKIGDDTVLWSGNHIGHHSTIGDHCFIASHTVISGCVTVEPYCYFGVNATVRDGITIKERCIIGAGALILKSTKPKEVYRGAQTEPYRFSSDAVKVV